MASHLIFKIMKSVRNSDFCSTRDAIKILRVKEMFQMPGDP